MSVYRNSPRLVKGALVSIDPLFNLPTSATVLQYNPAEMSRTVSVRQDSGGAAIGAMGADLPSETIGIKAHLDAADQLERGDAMAQSAGLHPQLAALELLVHRPSPSILASMALRAAGAIEVLPAARPLVVFAWGHLRTLPVHIGRLSIRETGFDNHLNPIRAEVDLTMEVVTYAELGWSHPGSWLYIANRVVREALAVTSSVQAAGQMLDPIAD
ncbi:hypothetical protein [Haliangium sp.]|uniref:hypothetical protein n=1 Tax=Haliangium sp. TaxID=2663208 RepID=UPI003D0D4E3F